MLIPSEQDINALIAVRLRAALALRKRSQQWLADQLRVSAGLVSQVLSGRVSLSAARLRQAAQLLQVDVGELYPPETYRPPPAAPTGAA